MKRPALQNKQVVLLRMAFRDFRETDPWLPSKRIRLSRALADVSGLSRQSERCDGWKR